METGGTEEAVEEERSGQDRSAGQLAAIGRDERECGKAIHVTAKRRAARCIKSGQSACEKLDRKRRLGAARMTFNAGATKGGPSSALSISRADELRQRPNAWRLNPEGPGDETS
jgi:hypothetical protein